MAAMLVPVPEIRTATRALCIMRCRPIVAPAPDAGASLDSATAFAGSDRADPVHGFAGFRKIGGDRIRLIRGDGQNHSDPAIERARHLCRFDVSLRLQKGH